MRKVFSRRTPRAARRNRRRLDADDIAGFQDSLAVTVQVGHLVSAQPGRVAGVVDQARLPQVRMLSQAPVDPPQSSVPCVPGPSRDGTSVRMPAM